MINYNKINKNINELLKEDNYIFQMKEFTDKMSKDYLNLLEKKSSILDLEEEYNDKISYRVILKNACGFIKDFNNKYYDILKTIYKKGFIKLKFNKRANPYCTLKHGHVYINWQVLYNMDSSFILVHYSLYYFIWVIKRKILSCSFYCNNTLISRICNKFICIFI